MLYFQNMFFCDLDSFGLLSHKMGLLFLKNE